MDQKETGDKAESAQRAEVDLRLDFLFRQSGDDPLMAQLRQAILQYRLENAQ